MRHRRYMLAGIGDGSASTGPLSAAQISDLLNRTPVLNADVDEWNALNLFATYNQTAQVDQEDFLTWLTSVTPPIPSDGYYVNDPVYGTVVIFPQADGSLDFTATGGLTGSAIALPQSSAGGSLMQFIDNLPHDLSQLGNSALWIIGGVVAIAVIVELKKK